MKKVMVRAWEIAKAAAAKFGGKVREYLAASLRQAWAESKDSVISLIGTKVVIVADEVSKKVTSVMAVVDGRIQKTYGPCDSKAAYMDAYSNAVNKYVGYGKQVEMYIRKASGVLVLDSVREISRKK